MIIKSIERQKEHWQWVSGGFGIGVMKTELTSLGVLKYRELGSGRVGSKIFFFSSVNGRFTIHSLGAF